MTAQALASVIVIAVTSITAVGAAVVAGVFYAFSSFVMRGLADTEPPSAALRSMQSINRTAVRPPLMLVLFGTLLAGIAACILLVLVAAGHALWWAIAAEAVYLVGVIGLTVAFHVPRNEALGRLDAAEPGTTDAWQLYIRTWTRANHIRVLAALASALLFAAAAGTVAVAWATR